MSETPSIWESFYFSTVGTVMLMPVFAHWCFCELRAKLADWDETLSAKLVSQRRFWWLVSRLGDGWLYVLIFLVMNGTRESIVYVLEAHTIAVRCFVAWGLGSFLKGLIRRRRQNPIRSRVRILNTLGSWSFPSQHAAVAVAFACALPNPFTIALAAAICVSRVLTGAHYLSDVAAGMVVGLVAWRM